MNSFYNPYMVQGNYVTELQNMRDRIDNQIQQVQHQQQNMQQPSINQTFQLVPNNIPTNFKLVNGLEDVKKEIVLVDTYFMTKDNSQMWIKNPKGELRTFEIQEIIAKDEKDLLIENLQKQIDELKGGTNNANEQYDRSNDEQSSSEFNEPVTTKKSTSIQSNSTSSTTRNKSK